MNGMEKIVEITRKFSTSNFNNDKTDYTFAKTNNKKKVVTIVRVLRERNFKNGRLTGGSFGVKT